MKMIGIIPIHFNNIENRYSSDLDSCNITRIFISNNNNCFVTKKTKLHKNNSNVLETFNNTFNTQLEMENTKIIHYGWIDNIYIYFFVIDSYKLISLTSTYESKLNKETYDWKVFMDIFKENELYPLDIYHNILQDLGEYNNVHLDYTLNLNDLSISIKDIYTKLTNIHILSK